MGLRLRQRDVAKAREVPRLRHIVDPGKAFNTICHRPHDGLRRWRRHVAEERQQATVPVEVKLLPGKARLLPLDVVLEDVVGDRIAEPHQRQSRQGEQTKGRPPRSLR